MIFRSLMIPNDRPKYDDVENENPRLWPCWKTCKCELELRAKRASVKETRAEKIAVLADTTTMKELKHGSGDALLPRLHSASAPWHRCVTG